MTAAERVAEPPLLRVDNVSAGTREATFLDRISLDVAAGEALGVLGPRGSGKTALIDVICGFLRPEHGRVIFAGHDITRWPPHRIVRAGLACSFQAAPLFEGNAAYDAIWAAAAAGGLSRGRWREAVEHALAISGLDARQFPGRCPDPIDRRLLRLACVAAAAPRLALLDEPLAGLAPPAAGRIVSVVRTLHDLGIALLVTGHDPAALRVICSRAVMLRDGRVTGGGRPVEMHRA